MKLLCIAVGIAAFGGAASAQSNVTLYGLVDLYAEHSNVGSASLNRLSSGGLYGSRWGMRGAEDLIGGLSAVFTLESGFSADTGLPGQGGRAFGRQSFVGLKGEWGQLLAGRQYAPIFTTVCLSDEDCFSTFSIPGVIGSYNADTLRQDNMLKYVLPQLGPFSGQVSYSFGEVAGNSGRQLGAHFGVDVGPATLMAGYNDNNIASTTVKDHRAYSLGAKSKFGNVTVSANYFNDHTDNVTAADLTAKGLSLGATARFGNASVIAQVGRIKTDRFAGASETAFLIGGNYALSKRTELYARYVRARDKNDASTAFWYAGDIPANQSNGTLALGMVHRF
jgi:predicted porin